MNFCNEYRKVYLSINLIFLWISNTFNTACLDYGHIFLSFLKLSSPNDLSQIMCVYMVFGYYGSKCSLFPSPILCSLKYAFPAPVILTWLRCLYLYTSASRNWVCQDTFCEFSKLNDLPIKKSPKSSCLQMSWNTVFKGFLALSDCFTFTMNVVFQIRCE